jgi:hypothetical protein
MLCVQSLTPDNERKDRPKHVDCYSINSKIVHLVGFTIEIYFVDFVQHSNDKETERSKKYTSYQKFLQYLVNFTYLGTTARD